VCAGDLGGFDRKRKSFAPGKIDRAHPTRHRRRRSPRSVAPRGWTQCRCGKMQRPIRQGNRPNGL